MTKLIVMLRHGHARAASEGSSDLGRPLSASGRRALEAHLPSALGLITPEESSDLALWTSEALRARQTADVAARILGVGPEAHASLTGQDLTGLLEELSRSERRCVVVVGHNPLMERAVTRMAGASVDMAPGACAAATVPDDLSRPGELAWYVQGPDVMPWKTLRGLERALRRCGRDVSRRLETFRDNPEDVEALHALRISVRVARGLANFCRPVMRKGAYRALMADLRAIVESTPRLRELDVLMEQVAALGEAGDELLVACRLLRADECARVRRALGKARVRRAEKDLRAVCAHPAWKRRLTAEGLGASWVAARLEELLDEVRGGRETVDFADARRTHDLRKRAKAVRYAAENAPSVSRRRAKEIAREMKAVQDALGVLCDARCNLQIIDAFPSSGLGAEAREALEGLRRQNQEVVDKLVCQGPEAVIDEG